jgi:hypothetical protein
MRIPYLVLWIRSGFNTDLDPVFTSMRIHADPDLVSSKTLHLPSQKT